MTVALGALPQIAHASCSGNACSSFKVENKTYSPSDKRFRATLVNTDPNKKIRLKGCMGSTKSPTPWCWDVSIDRGKSVPVENGVGIMDKPEEAAKHLKDFVVEITSAEFLEEVVAPKPPAKPADIKVSVVNGESEPLLVTIRDANDNSVVADRTLWNADPYEVRLTTKAGKGRLNWGVSTIPAGQSTAILRFIPWDGASKYDVGATVVYASKYYRAIKASQHIMPPNDEYWRQDLSIDKSTPAAKAKAKCGEGSADDLTAGAKVVLKASHGC
jgi:hypothetical protein